MRICGCRGRRGIATHPPSTGAWTARNTFLEATGCGCAFIDYDNDGWMDIFLLIRHPLDGDPPDASNRLYKNNRDGTFTDVTEKAGLQAVGWASGVCIGDYNNDGFDDIFCTYFGQNRLYRNNGDGTFTDVTKAAGLWNDQPRWGAGAVFLTTTVMAISICSFPTMFVSLSNTLRCRGRTVIATGKVFPWNADRADCPPGRHSSVPQQWRRNIHRCEPSRRVLRAQPKATE